MSRFLLRTIVAACPVWISYATEVQAHPPSGIVVDEDGTVFFQDGARGVWRVHQGQQPTLVNPLAWHWMALDPNGKFADSPAQFGEWFGRVTPRGERPALVVCSDFPCAMGQDGNLYFAHMHSLKIIRRTPDGTESVLVQPEQFGIEANRPYGVTGLICGPDGKLHLFSLNDDSGDHGLYTVAMDGTTQTFAANFITDTVSQGDRHPEALPEYCRGLAVDQQANVFIAATGSRCVLKVMPTGTASVVLRAEKPWSPTGVAELNGSVYVLEYDDETPTEGRNWPPRVRKVARDGKVETVVTISR